MTKSDIALQNSNGCLNLGAGAPNRGAGSLDGGIPHLGSGGYRNSDTRYSDTRYP